MTEEIHDMSRVDPLWPRLRRAMFFHSVWKPMLAALSEQTLMTAAVIGSVWVILPKISVREVVVDHVIQHDVPFDNHTPQDKPFDNYVPHNKPFDLPVPVPKPVASAAPMGPDSPYAPRTPDEKKFTSNPEYKDATYRRIVKSRDGRESRSRMEKTSIPATGTTPLTSQWMTPTGCSIPTILSATWHVRAQQGARRAVGMQRHARRPSGEGPWQASIERQRCAVHDYQVDPPVQSADGSKGKSPTTAAANMVNVNVDVAGYPIEAMVDTGCSFPMSVPKVYAPTR